MGKWADWGNCDGVFHPDPNWVSSGRFSGLPSVPKPMSDIKITVERIPRIDPNAFGFSAEEMREVGLAGLPFERLDSGLNRYDQPMEPLTKAYARRKQRRGAKPVRDLKLTGQLRNATEVEASENQAAIAVRTGGREWLKGHFNQLRSQWFGLSPNDAGKVDQKIDELHARHLTEAFE